MLGSYRRCPFPSHDSEGHVMAGGERTLRDAKLAMWHVVMRVVSTSRLGLLALHLDDMSFIFADNNIVATEDTTIVELIESVSGGTTVDSASDTVCDEGGSAP